MTFADPASLRQSAYRDPSKLGDRQSLYRFRVPGPGLHDRMVDAVDWSGVHRLADVGCGNAVYLDRLVARLPEAATVVGLDLSEGMVRSAGHSSGRVVADAQALPLQTAGFDAALALHMLYHVPDIPIAVRELRRVVRDGGVVVVVTNGSRHFEELTSVLRRPMTSMSRFGLDEADRLLGLEFGSVERHDARTTLEVPDVEPLAAYLRTMVSLGAAETAVEEAIAEAEAVIAADGLFRITVDPGFFLCR